MPTAKVSQKGSTVHKFLKFIQEDDFSTIKVLINDPSARPLLRERNDEGEGLLHMAVKERCGHDMVSLLVPHVPLGARDSHARTAFQLAIEKVLNNLNILLY